MSHDRQEKLNDRQEKLKENKKMVPAIASIDDAAKQRMEELCNGFGKKS